MPTVENAANGTGTPESLLRERLIDAARDGWTNRLIDLSRRNNLLFYKPTISGTLELPITPRMMAFVGDGEALPIRELLASDQDKITSVRAISRKGLENLEEKGLSTLYLALGRCTWTADDGGRDPIAPVLLIPIGLKLKGLDLPATEVQLAGEIEVNPVLLHIFNRELNMPLTAETVLSLFSVDDAETAVMEDAYMDESHATVNLQAVLDFLNAMASRVPGFRAEPFAVLGNFSFQKLAMVKDLENRRTELLTNDVVAAIAGDSDAIRNLGRSQIETDPSCLDTIPPDNEFAVVEADSSQQCAIVGICAGQSAVVHGPPGTGKSQTITNLIATLTAEGKKVLFVAEKRAALEVVMNRLKAVGLEHLAIDLHGAEQTPKKVMERVARTLSTVRETGKPVSEGVHEQFVDRRNKLNHHDARMHSVHAPTEQSVYAMQGALLRLPSNVSSPLRWRGPDLMQIAPKRAERVLDLLGEAVGFETLFNRSDSSPWTGIELRDGQAVQNAVDLADRLNHETIPSLKDYLNRVSKSSGLRQPKTMEEVNELLTVLRRSHRTLTAYIQDVFAEVDQLLTAMLPAQVGGIRGAWFRLTNGVYKAAYKQALILRKGVKASGSIIFGELTVARETRERWQRLSLSGAMPKAVAEMEAFGDIHQTAQAEIRSLESICKSSWDGLELADIAEKVSALSSDNSTPYRIRRLYEIEQELYSLGIQRLVDEIRITRRPAAQWGALFQHVWLKSTLDSAAINDPSIRGFVGSTHSGYVDDFSRLDSTRLKLAANRVRRAHAERTVAAMNQYPEQETLIRSEAAKSRRHKPLRRIFADATEV